MYHTIEEDIQRDFEKLSSLLLEPVVYVRQDTYNYILDTVESEIKMLIKEISLCDCIDNCFFHFNKLQDFEFVLGSLLYRFDYRMSEYLNVFVHDFDRVDDERSRMFLYKSIKTGKYT